ncbi:hypothetical protein LCGC14_1608900 [marine sediment metagenome]|uniref:Uncharacterized protein n=1 Tax=marine sediment metagenome TaxID=412755 RepID=A0A0F9IVL0_9ZZZZ
MIAKFNPTGTHVHKGFLKVRIDLYPDIGDKTYAIHHVQVPVIPPEGYQGKVDKEGNPVDQNDYDNWIDSLPKVWQLNPALCHFIRIKEASTKADLTDYLEQICNPTVIKTLDNSLILPNSSHLISPLMRNKSALTTEKIVAADIEDLLVSVNSRFSSLVLKKTIGDEGLPLKPQTIDIGPEAKGRSSFDEFGWTGICLDNPANATGTLTVLEAWAVTNTTGEISGTFYGSGTSYTCRDSEAIGAVTAGSKQTFSGLTISVETGDFLGSYRASGRMERDVTGYAGIYNVNAEYIDPDDNYAFYSLRTGDAISIYGTGTEAGAGWATISKVNAVGQADIGKLLGVDKANIAKVSGVTV